jgi:two-component system response regulator AtoC
MFFEAVSPSMRAVETVIGELGRSDVPVLLLAEAGSGKRTTAERIHILSRRGPQPFRALNCCLLSPEQFQTRPDRLFHEGTVFLAEVTDLSPACQAKLLDILPKCGENGQGQIAGARLIFGSSHGLEGEVKSDRFREDLYYRISGVCLRLPPLRQRKEDIPYLVSFFLEKYAQNFQRPTPVLSAETLHLFREYSWPGNVRELEDATKAIVALGDEAVAMGGLRSLLVKSDRGCNGERISLKQAARAASREAEKELILKVLTRTRWNRRRAAQELQISYKALLYKLKQISGEEMRNIVNSQERI